MDWMNGGLVAFCGGGCDERYRFACMFRWLRECDCRSEGLCRSVNVSVAAAVYKLLTF